jgi:serine/threonine protein kinase
MSHCLNPGCLSPQNPDDAEYCQRCQSRPLLNDRYRPLDPIGRGGFGRTFKARDEYKPSKPYCVIKQFHGKGFDDAAKAKELFHREAELQEKLGKHPQIPELLALCPQNSYLYLVQEFIDGCSLNQELKEKSTFSEDKIWQLLNDLLPILQFVHANQVIHRDVKPDNIIRHSADDKLFLVDFGIAKLATEAILVKTGTVIGIEGYTAPEQHEGKPHFASDLYSLGATCYHLLTWADPSRLLYRHVDWQKEIRGKLEIKDISDELIDVLTKLLQPDISQRYQSAEEVLEALVIQQTKISSDHLSSAVGIDYSKLRDLLAARKWQEADEETAMVMLQAAGREEECWLDLEHITNFPCEDLGIIDRLWVKYSDGRFGFSVQKRIWQEVGGQADYETERRLGDRVRWRVNNQWIDYSKLTFSVSAPLGQFPLKVFWLSNSFVAISLGVSHLALRFLQCNISRSQL